MTQDVDLAGAKPKAWRIVYLVLVAIAVAAVTLAWPARGPDKAPRIVGHGTSSDGGSSTSWVAVNYGPGETCTYLVTTPVVVVTTSTSSAVYTRICTNGPVAASVYLGADDE